MPPFAPFCLSAALSIAPLLAALVAGALLILLVFVGWRLFSNRQSLPCPVWLGWMVEMENPLIRANRAGVVISHLDLHPGMTALDAGCGPGRVTIPLSHAVGAKGRVTALDIQQGMLDRAAEKAREAGVENIDFLCGGLGEGLLPAGYFDRAVLITVLGEIPEREAAMQELFGALKPGGILSITEIFPDPHYQRQAVVKNLSASAGFTVKECIGSRLAYTLLLEKPTRT